MVFLCGQHKLYMPVILVRKRGAHKSVLLPEGTMFLLLLLLLGIVRIFTRTAIVDYGVLHRSVTGSVHRERYGLVVDPNELDGLRLLALKVVGLAGHAPAINLNHLIM